MAQEADGGEPRRDGAKIKRVASEVDGRKKTLEGWRTNTATVRFSLGDPFRKPEISRNNRKKQFITEARKNCPAYPMQAA